MSLQKLPPITDWDDAYSNGKYIPGSDTIVDEWNSAAAAFRDKARGDLDIAYGPKERQVYDLFWPEGAPKGLCVFIHGGYWLAFDKSSWSHLAAGPVDRGWATLLPSYTLAPDASLTDMAREMAAAVTQAARSVDGPIVITGHSAGGHLAVRLMCDDELLPADVLARVHHVLGISGLYDLRPLQLTGMNETLGINNAEARLESPALLNPVTGIRCTAWVGADERPEFRRQNRLLANIWRGLGADMQLMEMPDRHHFNVIADLADADCLLTQTLLEI